MGRDMLRLTIGQKRATEYTDETFVILYADQSKKLYEVCARGLLCSLTRAGRVVPAGTVLAWVT